MFIPKPGKDYYTSPKSFRPISLTSFLLKALERLIERHIKDFISINCPISGRQHAFQEGKSTETALHTLLSDIEYTLSHKEYAVCTFLDIEGAFDNVSFDAIDLALAKRDLGIPNRKWVSHLLTSRAITYEAYGRKTTVTPTRGSPQGGVLSPTFCILVMNELIVRLEREGFTVIGYADDLVIMCKGARLIFVFLMTFFDLSFSKFINSRFLQFYIILDDFAVEMDLEEGLYFDFLSSPYGIIFEL